MNGKGFNQRPTPPPLAPERIALLRQSAEGVIQWYGREDCRLSIQAGELLALCALAARGIMMMDGDRLLQELGLSAEQVAMAELDDLT